MNREKIPKIFQPFIFGEKNIVTELKVWLKAVVSLTGFWAFIPALVGIGVVYYGDYQGSDTRAWKGSCEVMA